MDGILAQAFKRTANLALGRLGYQLQRVSYRSTPPMEYISPDPGEESFGAGLRGLLYQVQIRPGMMTLPLKSARTGDLHPLAEHPYCRAATAALQNPGHAAERIAKQLTRYRDLCDFRSGADRMGLTATEAPGLVNTPGWLRLNPWSRVSVEEQRNNMVRAVSEEAERLGLYFESPGKAFLTEGGEAMIESHTQRVSALVDSMVKHGYQEPEVPNELLSASLLIGEHGNWCWQISQGHHRACVALALGMDVLRVRVNALIYRRDADIWPNVVSGVFTREGALKVFDNLVEGTSPEGSRPWVESLADGD